MTELRGVILAADDFGISAHTVERTIAAFDAGALTSASIMANVPETAAAAGWARAHSEHSFGVHLCFSTDDVERPVLPPSEIPGLVDSGGRFLESNTMRKRGLLNRLPADQIAREMEAQIARVRDLGVDLCYVDSHGHLHKFAPFRRALAEVLPRFGIRCVRTAQNVYLRKPLRSPTYWLGPGWARAIARQFVTTEHFYMPASAGDAEWAEPALALLRARGGVAEVGVHPGLDVAWRENDDRGAFAFAAAARAAGVDLIGWRDLAAA